MVTLFGIEGRSVSPVRRAWQETRILSREEEDEERKKKKRRGERNIKRVKVRKEYGKL